MKKNNAIEFWRFAMAWMIGIMHFNKRCEVYEGVAFRGAYIGAEFFFLLSGFFLMKRFYDRKVMEDKPLSLEEKNERDINETKLFLVSKIKRIFPQYIISFAITLVIYKAMHEWTLDVMLKRGFWECFMLQNVGIYDRRINVPAWYICAMLVASYFIYYMLQKNAKKFIYIIAPAGICMIYAYISANFGHLSTLSHISICITTGMLRAFAAVSIGCITYECYKKLEIKWQDWNPLYVTAAELFLWFCIVVRMWGVGHGKVDFMMVILMAAAILLTFTGKGYFSRGLNNRFSGLLGKLSYAVYLNHWVVMKMMTFNGGTAVAGYAYEQQIRLFFVIVMVFSLLTTLLIHELGVVFHGKGKKNVNL